MTNTRLDALVHQAREKRIMLEVGARKLTEEHLSQYLDLAERLEAKLLRFVLDGPGYEPAEDTVISILKNFVRTLEEKEIILGLENHDRIKARQFDDRVE